MILLVLIPIAVIFSINCVVSSRFEKIAFQKGYDSSFHCYAMCFWLGIIGYLYVIALPDLKRNYIITGTNDNLHEKANNAMSNEETESEPYDKESLKEKYDDLLARAEMTKDPYFDRDYKIYAYESIVREMRDLASINFEDSVAKLQEYNAHLELLKAKKIK